MEVNNNIHWNFVRFEITGKERQFRLFMKKQTKTIISIRWKANRVLDLCFYFLLKLQLYITCVFIVHAVAYAQVIFAACLYCASNNSKFTHNFLFSSFVNSFVCRLLAFGIFLVLFLRWKISTKLKYKNHNSTKIKLK